MPVVCLCKTRLIRSTSGARGPYLDKDGFDCAVFDATRNRYGATMLLGPEADQLVPGHPHVWEEAGTYYLGYDYRASLSAEVDRMGIRKLHWATDGWPTVWTPIQAREHAAIDARRHVGVGQNSTSQTGIAQFGSSRATDCAHESHQMCLHIRIDEPTMRCAGS